MDKFVKIVAASGAVLAIAAGATPAAAQQGPYVGLSGGYVLPNNSDNTGETTAAVPATDDWPAIPSGTAIGWKTKFDDGYAISAQAGYAFDNGIRLELEGFYSHYGVKSHSGVTVGGSNIDGLDVGVVTRDPPTTGGPTVGQFVSSDTGRVSTYGVFANAFYDLDAGGGFRPYVGGGIGYVSTDVRYEPSGVSVLDDKDGGAAWQVMGGASFAIARNVDLFAQYTYRDRFNDAKVRLDALPADFRVQTAQSILSTGLRFRFGG